MVTLWSRDCFKILPFVMMQRVALVCQRQLSCLLISRFRHRTTVINSVIRYRTILSCTLAYTK